MSAAELRATAAFDVEAVRAQFPGLHQNVRNKPLVYLDSAATSQKPQAVLDAYVGTLAMDAANVHRGVHALSQRSTDRYEAARETIRRFLGAESVDEIVFVRGTTEAINLVAFTLGRQRLGPGREVLITGLEHHSNIVPWQLLCAQTGATLKVVPLDDRGDVSLEAFREALSERTSIVSCAHISNALGTILPVAEMARLAHEVGAVILVDGAQAVPHMPVDVRALDADFYAFSGHKVFAPAGIGALYGRASLLEDMPPWQGGGDMIRHVTFERTVYAKPPTRFEAGTPNFSGAIGLGAALEWLMALDFAAVAAHEAELLSYGTERLQQVEGLRLVGTAPKKAGVLSFLLEGIHPHDIGTILDMEGIAVRAGHHCAQPVMQHFGIPATTRASLALYNTRADIDALVVGLDRVRELFG